MKNISCLILTMAISLTGCKYLNIVPENDIKTVDVIFEKRNGAEDWLRTCYLFLYRSMSFFGHYNVATIATDEYVAGEYARKDAYLIDGLMIADGQQMSQKPYGGNLWSETEYYVAIRYTNIFIEKIDQVYNMTDVEKTQWKAEAKALKALLYFELVRRYGPIVLVPVNIPANQPVLEMQIARSPVDECFKAIVDLLDEAIVELVPIGQKSYNRLIYFCKEGALALKARALLYAASPLFNGNEYYADFKNKDGVQLFNSTYDAEKWKLAAEAADEAIAFCIENGRSLVQGEASRTNQFTNVMVDIAKSALDMKMANPEVLFGVRYDDYQKARTNYQYTLPLLTSVTTTAPANYNPCLGASMKMVELFYTQNGLPIDADRDWNYSGRYTMGKETSSRYEDVVLLNQDVLNLHLRREPRFYANIGAHGTIWWQGKTTDDKRTTNCLRGKDFGTQETIITSSAPQNLSGYWVKKRLWPDVAINTYFSEITTAEEGVMPVLRLAELYLISAEAWNEYEGPSQKVYDAMNVVRSRAGVPDVEVAWQSYSRSPDKVKSKEGLREIIRREIDIEFAFEGHRFYNLRRWKTAHIEMNQKQFGWNILGDTETKFFNNWEGPIEVWTKYKFTAPRDYLFPIRAEEILISGNKQNPGW